MKIGLSLCILIFRVGVGMVCVAGAQEAKSGAKAEPAVPAQATVAGREYSGMYSFLSDGEFVQISVEEAGRVTGFVSRYGDKGGFVDQYFKSGKIEGNKVEFVTQTVQEVWFAFAGTVERGDGKNPGDEGYYVLKGTLTENSIDVAKKVNSETREVVLRGFPTGDRK